MSRSKKRVLYILSVFFFTALVLSYFIYKNDSYGHDSVSVNILGISDYHGQLDLVSQVDHQSVGTAAYLGRYLAQKKIKNPNNTFLVHAGDVVGASPPISHLLNDEPTIQILNTLQFDIGTLGNHEFDKGLKEMFHLINGGYHPSTGHFEGAKFPYISANVINKHTKKLLFPPSWVKKVQGIPIGFIGVTTKETPVLTNPNVIKDISFLDEGEAINKEAKKLKKKGIHTIIVLAHEGGFIDHTTGKITGAIKKIANKLDTKIDVIIAGHTDQNLNGTINNTLIVQAENYGTAFADVHLEINRNTGAVTSKKAKIIHTFHKGITPYQPVEKIVTRSKNQVAAITNKVISKTDHSITRKSNEAGESTLANLIADSQRVAMKTDFAFVQTLGIRGDIQQGKITWGELFAIHPFNNYLIRMELTGNQIRKVLNQQFQKNKNMLNPSGLLYTYQPSRKAGDQIVDIRTSQGKPIIADKIYTVSVNNFLANGGDNFNVFKQGRNRRSGPNDLNALIDYLKKNPKPSKKIEGRMKIIN